jgi:type IV pilus assembly protein PilE
MHKTAGFNLIELMIGVLIISLLTVMAYPGYTSHLSHQSRLAAEITLARLASALEQYYLEHDSFDEVTFSALNFPERTADEHYQLAIQTRDASDFILTAKPLVKKTECGTLRLTSRGERTAENCS